MEFNTHKQMNSKDLEGLKRISRALLKSFGTKEPILKDEAIKIAKRDPDTAKRMIPYINTIYGKSNKITQAEFAKKAKPTSGPTHEIASEQEHQTLQRLVPHSELNKTISTGILDSKFRNTLVDFSKEKRSEEVSRQFGDFIADVLDPEGAHFDDASAFARYTKVRPDWIHIDAIQTDLFNKVRKKAAKEKYKGEMKSLVSKLLATEEDTYKAAVSFLKKKYPSAKVWTMNTPDLAKRAENIQSGDKTSKMYQQLPPKLGFKMTPMDKFKKILGTRPGKNSDSKNIGGEFERTLTGDAGKNSETLKKIRNKFRDTKHLDNVIDSHKGQYEKIYASYNMSMAQDVIAGTIRDALKKMPNLIPPDNDFGDNHRLLDNFGVFAATRISKVARKDHDKFKKEIKRQFSEYMNSYIEKYKFREQERGTPFKSIWWANKDMVNEDYSKVLNILDDLRL